MRTRIALLLLIILTTSCDSDDNNIPSPDYKPKQEAIDLQMRAIEIWQSDSYNIENVDSALILLDKAVSIDTKYTFGYMSIVGLCLAKKDYEKALETNTIILSHFEDSSAWYTMQQGVILELMGDTLAAQHEFDNSIYLYEKIGFEKENLDWLSEMNYVEALIWGGYDEKAHEILERVLLEHPEFEEPFKLFRKSKQELLKLLENPMESESRKLIK